MFAYAIHIDILAADMEGSYKKRVTPASFSLSNADF
jgi:hypothetical protein